MYDGSAIAAAEIRFREDLWRTAPSDAVEEAAVKYRRFGPLLATVFGELPFTSLLHVVQGAAEPEVIDRGYLAAAVEWLRTWEVDYRVSVAADRPGTKRAEQWLSARGYEPGATVRRYVHTDSTAPDVEADAIDIRDLKPLETESVHDKDLTPMALGDLMHFRMGTALEKKCGFFPTDPLEAVKEVGDEFQLKAIDSLKVHIRERSPLVTGSRRSERDQSDLSSLLSIQPHQMLKLNRTNGSVNAFGTFGHACPSAASPDQNIVATQSKSAV
jgi:hypothetical protein